MGRQTILTPELHAQIVQNVKDGMTRLHAVLEAGVATRTLESWLARYQRILAGKHGDTRQERETDEKIVQLMEDIDEAEASYIAKRVRKVNQKLEGQYSGVKDEVLWLERRFPEWFRKRETTEVIGNPNAPLQIEEVTPEDERLRNARLLAILTDRGFIPRPLIGSFPSAGARVGSGTGGDEPGGIEGSSEIIDAEDEQVHSDSSLPETDGVPPVTP